MLDLEKLITIGQTAVISKKVQRSDTVGNHSEGLNDLLATPICVDMVIKASVEAVNKQLPEGYITVGQSVAFTHDYPTELGMTVNVKATLKEIHGSHLLFDIVAWDELGDVGHGKHERVVVDREGIRKKAKARNQSFVGKQSFGMYEKI